MTYRRLWILTEKSLTLEMTCTPAPLVIEGKAVLCHFPDTSVIYRICIPVIVTYLLRDARASWGPELLTSCPKRDERSCNQDGRGVLSAASSIIWNSSPSLLHSVGETPVLYSQQLFTLFLRAPYVSTSWCANFGSFFLKNTAPWWFEKEKKILGAKWGSWRLRKLV